jgi:RNA polymerase sigma-70 factor (ECF subfamily)
MNRLKDAHRRHILAARQAVDAEQPLDELGIGSVDALNTSLAETVIGPGKQAIQSERSELLRRGLDQLQKDDQHVLSLRYDSGLRVKEIAASLNLSESAVKVRHFRAVQRLRVILEELHFDET